MPGGVSWDYVQFIPLEGIVRVVLFIVGVLAVVEAIGALRKDMTA